MVIYDINGKKLLDAILTESAEHEQELSKSDFVKFVWESDVKITVPAGSYIVPFEDGLKYRLLNSYTPAETDKGFRYDISFHHPLMWLSRVPFLYVENDLKQQEWSFDGLTVSALEYVCKAINEAFGITDDAQKFTYTLCGTVDGSVSFSVSSNDILSVLSSIAQACKDNSCEWHLSWEHHCLYFGQIAINLGEEVPLLKVHDNIQTASVSESKEDYYNCFYPQGSTKNMSRKAQVGTGNVATLARLGLDTSKYPDGCIYVGTDGKVITKAQFDASNAIKQTLALSFDDIYPHIDLYAYNIRKRTRYLKNDTTGDYELDSKGNKKVYAVWYMRLAYCTTTKDTSKALVNTTTDNGVTHYWYDYDLDVKKQVLQGYTLKGTFKVNTHTTNNQYDAITQPLVGQPSGQDGFELYYHEASETLPASEPTGDSGVSILKGDYEIVMYQSGDTIIPTNEQDGLIPHGKALPDLTCNIVVLFNIVMGEYESKLAQEELATRTIKEINRRTQDNNNYTAHSNAVEFAKKNPHLYIGQRVIYDDGFGYQLSTRVIKLVTKLDYPIIQEITVGNQAIKGTITQLREDVTNILSGNFSGGGINSVQALSIVRNYVDSRFLSKTKDDTAQGLITFLKGIKLGGKEYGITADGIAELAELIINKTFGIDKDGNATVGSLSMSGYEPGIKGLKMWLDEQGKSHAQVDFIEVLAKAVYHELEVRHMVGISGDQMQSAAASVLLDALPIVEEGTILGWKCHLKTDDGTTQTLNTWVAGDQAYCHVSNLRLGTSTDAANRTYWRVVSEVAQKTESEEAYIVITNVAPYYHEGMADVPQPGDSVVQFGYNAAWALAHGIDPSKHANRMNVRMSTVSDGDGPTEALYRAVSGFDYSIEQNAVKYVSGERIFMRSKDMIWLSESGAKVPNVIHMGDWPEGGTMAHAYESWQHGGSTWLCVRDTTDEPSATSPDWRVYAAKGKDGLRGPQGFIGPKGEKGIAGPKGNDGTDGKTSYFHVKYSDVASPTAASQMNETGGDYIGTYVDFTEADSTDPTKYNWTLVKGERGADGITQTPYIRYSDDGGRTFTAEKPWEETQPLLDKPDEFSISNSSTSREKTRDIARIPTEGFSAGEDYTLSFDYRCDANVKEAEVLFFSAKYGKVVNFRLPRAEVYTHVAISLKLPDYAADGSYFILRADNNGAVTEGVEGTGFFRRFRIDKGTEERPGDKGRNLARGTFDFSGDGWGRMGEGLVDEIHEGLRVRRQPGSYNQMGAKVKCLAGHTYTFSYYARSDADNKSRWQVRDVPVNDYILVNTSASYQKISTEWNRYSASFKFLADGLASFSVEKQMSEGNLYLCGFKVELGDTATPWTPAPEDQQFGTTAGRYMGVAFSDKGYPPFGVGDYDWSETKGRGVSSVTRYFALSNSGTVAPSGGYDANPKTPTATARYLWVYDKTSYDTGDTVVGTPYVLSVHGQDGKDALTINVKPQTIIVDTDADGHVTANQLGAATTTIEAWVGGMKTTSVVAITNRSAGIGATVSGPTVAVSAIADDPTTRMAYGSGWIDITVTADGKAVPVRIPVATNIHKVVPRLEAANKSVIASVSSMKQEALTEAETRATALAQAARADAERYAKQYTDAAIEITEGKIAQTVSKEAYDANNTRIESQFTQVLQTASEYSIMVGQEAAGRNLLEGGWLDVTGWQYGVLNALNMLPHVSLKAGHTYTLTVCAANTARPSVYHVRAHIFDAEWRDSAGITITEAEDTIRSVTFTAKYSDIYFVDFYPQDNEGKPAAAQGCNIRVQWATLVEGRVGKTAWQPSEQDELNTGLDMKKGTIGMVADRFTLRNNQGEKTMGVDEDGNFMVQGVIKADTLLRKYAETRTGMSVPGQDVFGIELQELNGKISPVKYMPPDILVVVTPSGASPFLRLPWAGHCVGRVLDIYGENYNVMSAATYAPTTVTAQGNDAYINGGGAGSDVGPEPIYSDYENQCFQLVGSHSCQTITMNTWNNVAGQAHLRLIAADVGGAAGAPNYRWVVLNMTNCRPNT